MNYERLNNWLNHILYFLDEKDKQWNCISCYMQVTKIGSIFQLLEHLYCKKGPFTFSIRGTLRLDAYHSKNMYIMSFYHLFLFPPNNNLKQQATTDFKLHWSFISSMECDMYVLNILSSQISYPATHSFIWKVHIYFYPKKYVVTDIHWRYPIINIIKQ